MRQVRSRVVRFIIGQDGNETLEWGLICGLIIAFAVAVVAVVAPKISGLWSALANSMNSF